MFRGECPFPHRVQRRGHPVEARFGHQAIGIHSRLQAGVGLTEEDLHLPEQNVLARTAPG
jgi:hypothetical protein